MQKTSEQEVLYSLPLATRFVRRRSPPSADLYNKVTPPYSPLRSSLNPFRDSLRSSHSLQTKHRESNSSTSGQAFKPMADHTALDDFFGSDDDGDDVVLDDEGERRRIVSQMKDINCGKKATPVQRGFYDSDDSSDDEGGAEDSGKGNGGGFVPKASKGEIGRGAKQQQHYNNQTSTCRFAPGPHPYPFRDSLRSSQHRAWGISTGVMIARKRGQEGGRRTVLTDWAGWAR